MNFPHQSWTDYRGKVNENGVGLQRWSMKHESFAIIVLDASGKVLFAKDGPLSENEIEYAIKLIENQII